MGSDDKQNQDGEELDCHSEWHTCEQDLADEIKNKAYVAITIYVSDDIVYLVSKNDDMEDVWHLLKRNFQLDDQVQRLLLS